jgi:hypothetical protein
MVYKKQFAAAIRVNGKILREKGEQVFLPLGSEYQIILKNLNSVRASVKVWIDGTCVTGDYSLIVNTNSSVTLERSIANNNLSIGNCFKFIKRTDSIEQHRGIKIDDGLVRIEYQFEKVFVPVQQPPQVHWNHPPVWSDTTQYGPVGSGTIRCANLSGSMLGKTAKSKPTSYSAAASVAGITVPGSQSNQSFKIGSSFVVEPEVHSMVLQLVGEVENHVIVQPITVNHKPECITCGRKNKASSKFCSNCGTALQLFHK